MNKYSVGICEEILMNIKDLPYFIKSIKNLFYQFKLKTKSRYQYIKYYLLYDASIKDTIEILKEKNESIKLYMKAHPVQSILVV